MTEKPDCNDPVDYRGRRYRCTRPKGHRDDRGHESFEITDSDGKAILMRWSDPTEVSPTTRGSR